MEKKEFKFLPFRPCHNCHRNIDEHVQGKCLWGPDEYEMAAGKDIGADWYETLYREWEHREVVIQ